MESLLERRVVTHGRRNEGELHTKRIIDKGAVTYYDNTEGSYCTCPHGREV